MDGEFAAKIVDVIEDVRDRTGEKLALIVDVAALREVGAPARRQLGQTVCCFQGVTAQGVCRLWRQLLRTAADNLVRQDCRHSAQGFQH